MSYSPFHGDLPSDKELTAMQKDYLSNQSQYDFLTGLPAATLFFVLEDLGRKKNLENGDYSAILYFNFRGMRDYNRKFGLGEGDALILDFSKLLSKHFGKECCGRFSSDHFVAFAKAEGIEDTLKAIFKEEKNLNNGRSLPLIAGVYLDEIEYVNASMACDRAKMACEKLKSSSVSAFNYFDMEMLENERRRQYIIDNLDKAIEEHWIQVYYQPIIRVITGRVCEEESLARWIDPEMGMISPGEFIPVLEDNGLIHKLDLCVIDQVLEKMKVFDSRGLYVVPGSVNISRSDFDACDMVEEIRRRVDEAGIPRDRLNIEITESVIGKDFEYIKTQVERFRSLGFQVWMDDFGSGYSSLDVLQNIQFDLIKLDMRFIQQLDKIPASRIIMTDIIKMITELGAETLCEGVETKEQLEFLRDIGCMKVQGFYFTRAESEEEILNRYRTGKAIGMENPQETDYYAAVSRFNINDPSVVSSSDPNAFVNYMDTVPVVVLELGETTATMIHCNSSGRKFVTQFDNADKTLEKVVLPLSDRVEFTNALFAIQEGENWKRITDILEDGTAVHVFARLLSINPITKARAVALIVLAIIGQE